MAIVEHSLDCCLKNCKFGVATNFLLNAYIKFNAIETINWRALNLLRAVYLVCGSDKLFWERWSWAPYKLLFIVLTVGHENRLGPAIKSILSRSAVANVDIIMSAYSAADIIIMV